MSSEYAENRAQDAVIRRDSMQAPYATPAPLDGLTDNAFQRSGAQGDDNSAYTAPLQPPSFTRQNPVQPQGAKLIAPSGDRLQDLAADSILSLASTAVRALTRLGWQSARDFVRHPDVDIQSLSNEKEHYRRSVLANASMRP